MLKTTKEVDSNNTIKIKINIKDKILNLGRK